MVGTLMLAGTAMATILTTIGIVIFAYAGEILPGMSDWECSLKCTELKATADIVLHPMEKPLEA